ncbi:MAG: SRPBCC family protein [Weeksellaceae bacterium]|nr:SRPBCC family protein [Weeksellaceae bacterium]
MIQSAIEIQAPAHKIWKALTTPELMKEWYFDIPDFQLEKGAVFNFYEPGGANQFHHQCEILEIEENKTFAHTWRHPSISQGNSVVTWTLNPLDENNTQVSLTHQGTESFADAGELFSAANYQMGWDGFMYALKNYMHGLRRLTFQEEIEASPQTIWRALWQEENYKKWAAVFHPGTFWKGDLQAGGRVHFLTPEGHGMASNVVFYDEPNFVLFQQMLPVENFEEQPATAETKFWEGSFESYRVTTNGDTAILTAEVDSTPDHVEYFEKQFPIALEMIKQIAESR